MTDYETILVEQRDAVTLVTLNRPKALNALNNQVLSELIDHHVDDHRPGLGERTGEARWLQLESRALAYERRLFVPSRDNWPDLLGPRLGGASGQAPRFLTAWCHGAPGIGLARLRALLRRSEPRLARWRRQRMIDLYAKEYMREYGAEEAYKRWVKTQNTPEFNEEEFEREFLEAA